MTVGDALIWAGRYERNDAAYREAVDVLAAEVLRLRAALKGAHVVTVESQRRAEAAELETFRLKEADGYNAGWRDGVQWGGEARDTLEIRAAVAEAEVERLRDELDKTWGKLSGQVQHSMSMASEAQSNLQRAEAAEAERDRYREVVESLADDDGFAGVSYRIRELAREALKEKP